jgi:2-alkyl-3-oxoalkanoate reductase
MRVFVAGATGALGARLVPQLVERGYDVIGTSRSAGRAQLEAQGAEPVVLDLLDARAVRDAVVAARPDAIVHQATSLAGGLDTKHFDRSLGPTNRLRVEGTDALLAGAHAASVERIVAQSYAGWPSGRGGGAVATEEEPARRLAGDVGVALLTEVRGVSNAKAKRELGWTLRYPTWRDGFVSSYADLRRPDRGRLSEVA